MWKRLIAMSLTFGVAAAGPPAWASTCATHDAVVEKLEGQYGETVVGRGLESETTLYEIWRSPETGSWTIVLVSPDGVACVMASGAAWAEGEPQFAGTRS